MRTCSANSRKHVASWKFQERLCLQIVQKVLQAVTIIDQRSARL